MTSVRNTVDSKKCSKWYDTDVNIFNVPHIVWKNRISFQLHRQGLTFLHYLCTNTCSNYITKHFLSFKTSISNIYYFLFSKPFLSPIITVLL